MNYRLESAKSTLHHYMKTVWLKAGLKWDEFNETTVNGIVEDLVAGIDIEIKTAIEEFSRRLPGSGD